MVINAKWFNSWRWLFKCPREADFWLVRCDVDWSRSMGYYTLTVGLLGVWCHITLARKQAAPVESLGRDS